MSRILLLVTVDCDGTHRDTEHKKKTDLGKEDEFSWGYTDFDVLAEQVLENIQRICNFDILEILK